MNASLNCRLLKIYFPNKMDTACVCQNDPILALTPNATCMRDFGGLYQVHQPLSLSANKPTIVSTLAQVLYQMLRKSDRVACSR